MCAVDQESITPAKVQSASQVFLHMFSSVLLRVLSLEFGCLGFRV